MSQRAAVIWISTRLLVTVPSWLWMSHIFAVHRRFHRPLRIASVSRPTIQSFRRGDTLVNAYENCTVSQPTPHTWLFINTSFGIVAVRICTCTSTDLLLATVANIIYSNSPPHRRFPRLLRIAFIGTLSHLDSSPALNRCPCLIIQVHPIFHSRSFTNLCIKQLLQPTTLIEPYQLSKFCSRGRQPYSNNRGPWTPYVS